MTDLKNRRCQPCEGNAQALDKAAAAIKLREITGWTLNDTATEINRTFSFKNFYETMAFVNAVAWIANREDHHPDLEVSYKRCRVRYNTHTVKGLSDNDFICAAKINDLVGE